MNALIARNISKRSTTIARSLSSGPIPTASTAQSGGYKVMGLPHLSTPAMKAQYRKKNWLSDPSTYPLIACLAGAGALCGGFGIYFLFTAPDVQISPLKRNSTMRNWQ